MHSNFELPALKAHSIIDRGRSKIISKYLIACIGEPLFPLFWISNKHPSMFRFGYDCLLSIPGGKISFWLKKGWQTYSETTSSFHEANCESAVRIRRAISIPAFRCGTMSICSKSFSRSRTSCAQIRYIIDVIFLIAELLLSSWDFWRPRSLSGTVRSERTVHLFINQSRIQKVPFSDDRKYLAWPDLSALKRAERKGKPVRSVAPSLTGSSPPLLPWALSAIHGTSHRLYVSQKVAVSNFTLPLRVLRPLWKVHDYRLCSALRRLALYDQH
jgi:hypothetical protein